MPELAPAAALGELLAGGATPASGGAC